MVAFCSLLFLFLFLFHLSRVARYSASLHRELVSFFPFRSFVSERVSSWCFLRYPGLSGSFDHEIQYVVHDLEIHHLIQWLIIAAAKRCSYSTTCVRSEVEPRSILNQWQYEGLHKQQSPHAKSKTNTKPKHL